ncbi:MAG: hypothetical protein WA211_21085 [Candidatus Acidiferrales bacterium]
MTGKAYYLTTLGAWRRHVGRLTNSHWLALKTLPEGGANTPGETVQAAATEDTVSVTFVANNLDDAEAAGTAYRAPTGDAAVSDETPILALIEADEGGHLALLDDADFEQLPHPLAPKPISDAALSALGAHGVTAGATTFEAAEAVAGVHPLLRHHVF